MQTPSSTSPPPPIVNPPPPSTGDQDYGEDVIDSEEDYPEGEDEDEDLDTRPPPSQSSAGRASTIAPSRSNRPGSSTNGGRGNAASNLLVDEDEDDIDSLLSSNARVEPNGI